MYKKNFYSAIVTLLSFAHANLSAQTLSADTSLSGIYNYVKSATDAERMAAMTELFLAKPGSGADSRADQCCEYVAIAYAWEGKLEKAVHWLSKRKEPATRNMGITAVMKELLKAGHLEMAERFLETAVVTQSGIDKRKLDDLKGELLFRQGKFDAALPLLKAAYERTKYGAELYLLALLKSGDSASVFEEVDKIAAKELYLSEAFKTTAKAAYRKKFGKADRIASIFDSAAAAQQKEMAEKVAKMAVDQPAPDFELTDLNGNTVSLKSLRGKTVFIDFWATWCGPCVYSFPGMQKAVDYYKNDTSVVFLFVHSYERVPNATQEVKRYISDKKYRFDVYMDLGSTVAKNFNVTHLPTKLVIDKNGMLKAKGAGLIMEERAIPEVKAMIELGRR